MSAMADKTSSAARGNHVLDDDWTVKTDDGSWAAHFEHTFAFTADGLWVLTAPDGGKSRLEPLGLYGPVGS